MAILNCKMCGGNLKIEPELAVCVCEYCGSKQTVPIVDDEKKISLFARANRLRFACEFDKAYSVYESIVTEYQDEAEAYWGLVLCKYGIEYIDDPKTDRKIPTCHRSSFDSIFEDFNFEMVMECSDVASRAVYCEEAKRIEELRMAIIESSSQEEAYEIFICYKETDEKGERTIDSVLAQDVYDALTDKGYKVFFSRITLEDKLGQEYEPCIFAALNSSKIMLVFGTDYEYYNAVWVKNEWRRFLDLIEKGEKKTLIPCYKDIDAYDMPKEFKHLQAQDMGKVGAVQDLIRGIEKIIGQRQTVQIQFSNMSGKNSNPLVQRGMMYLEDGEFDVARDYFDRSLDINPVDSNAYLGKFLAENKLNSITDLEGNKIIDFEKSKDFMRAVQFAAPENLLVFQKMLNDNDLKIARTRFLYALQQHYKRTAKNEIQKIVNEKTRLAYECLASGGDDAYENALLFSEELMSDPVINRSPSEHDRFKEELKIACFVINLVRESTVELNSYAIRRAVINSGIGCMKDGDIDKLLKYGLLDSYVGLEGYTIYTIPGMKEERQAIIEARQAQKTAYKQEVDRINQVVKTELKLQQDKIISTYAVQKQSVILEMETKILEAEQAKKLLDERQSELENLRASLGIFQKRKKNDLTEKIEYIVSQLHSMPSVQTIRQQYQEKIVILEYQEKKEIRQAEATIRELHPYPQIEDF